jgi:NAD(P)-dependent dehydrogenase (short-subunit alcohol dehydrogenase family)
MPGNERMSVVITGASAGLGRAVAIEFARRGWNIGLMARGLEGLEGAAADVEAHGGAPLILPTDVANAEDVEAAADRAAAEWGAIDVWVNGAMVTVLSPVREMQAEEYRRVTEVTYLGQVHGTLAALRHMRSPKATSSGAPSSHGWIPSSRLRVVNCGGAACHA